MITLKCTIVHYKREYWWILYMDIHYLEPITIYQNWRTVRFFCFKLMFFSDFFVAETSHVFVDLVHDSDHHLWAHRWCWSQLLLFDRSSTGDLLVRPILNTIVCFLIHGTMYSPSQWRGNEIAANLPWIWTSCIYYMESFLSHAGTHESPTVSH